MLPTLATNLCYEPLLPCYKPLLQTFAMNLCYKPLLRTFATNSFYKPVLVTLAPLLQLKTFATNLCYETLLRTLATNQLFLHNSSLLLGYQNTTGAFQVCFCLCSNILAAKKNYIEIILLACRVRRKDSIIINYYILPLKNQDFQFFFLY